MVHENTNIDGWNGCREATHSQQNSTVKCSKLLTMRRPAGLFPSLISPPTSK
jgi:hypothetical protein